MKKEIFKFISILTIFSFCLIFNTTATESETVSPLQKFIVYSISLEESARIEVAEVLETCIGTKNNSTEKAQNLLSHFPDMTHEEIKTALETVAICTKAGANSLCDLILFGPVIPEHADKMPNIIANINKNIIENPADNRGSVFFYSLLNAYNLYTIFGGNPDIATNMADLPGLIDMKISGLSYEISRRISTAIELMPSLQQSLESYGQDTLLGNLLKMSEECANDEATEEIYYFKISLEQCGSFYGNQPSMRGNEKFDGLTFRDIDNCTWAHSSIKNLSEKGIINGFDKYRFGPSNNITREQFVKIVVSALNIDISKTTDVAFKDADKSQWYYPYLCAAYSKKIITGETAETFGIGNPITREQMATIIYRAYTGEGYTFERKGVKHFLDALKISDYATEAVDKMSSSGVITGMENGNFEPKEYASRSQAAVMIDRANAFIK